jgi:hypothetical protein
VYGTLAGLVALTHGAIVACVVVGSLAAILGRMQRRRRVAGLFYSLLGLVVASDLFLGDCALTRLEQRLRNLSQPGSAYSGSFIGHYFGFMPPVVHHWIGPALVVSALAAYPLWWFADRRQITLPNPR